MRRTLRSLHSTRAVDERLNVNVLHEITSKNHNRPQTDVARSQDHPVTIYNSFLVHFITDSLRSSAEVLARGLIGTCTESSSLRTSTMLFPNEWGKILKSIQNQTLPLSTIQ